MDKQEFKFCGVNIGLCSGWDGDHEMLTFYDVEPSNELVSAFPGDLESIVDEDTVFSVIHFMVEPGIMQIYNDDNKLIVETSFKIMHQ